MKVTLRTLRQRLVNLRDGLTEDEQDRFLNALTVDDDIDVESLVDEIDEIEEDTDGEDCPVDGRLLATELAELDSLIDRADRITSDSKSKALLIALEAAFNRLRDLGANRKALIFTESRKTQAFLASYLEANGHAGRVVSFNGSNTHANAKEAYDRFISRHAGTDKVTGSKPIDVRSALIEDFRDRADILLATEAAAEGINLQFCSLVVNYDLPWNPQRIEQRVGRCHRYGQKHDVVVVNFLSKDNIADQRVQDLLQQKFSLFDELFGVSDEVMGAIESGVDFEQRILTILKSCRTDKEIEEAFDTLQGELEETISQKMDEARQQLLEYFDADVHERLNVRGENARLALDRVGERFWKLTHWGLDGQATFDDDRLGFFLPKAPLPEIPDGEYRLISTARTDDDYAATEAHLLRLSSPLGQWLLTRAKKQSLPTATIRFDITNHDRKISMLQPLVGTAGHLRVDKLTLDSDAREEFLLLTAITEQGENLDQELTQRLLDVAGHEAGPYTIPSDIATRLDADADRLAQATLARATENGNERFKQVQAQVNHWADDKIKAAELELDTIRRELRAARRTADLAETVQGHQEAQKCVAQIERKRRHARKHIDEVEDHVERERLELIRQLRNRSQQHTTRETLFAIAFTSV